MFYANFLINLLVGTSIVASSGVSLGTPISVSDMPNNTPTEEAVTQIKADIPDVPFYSQFKDISAPEWQKIGCGIASLAMLIEFNKPGSVSSVNALLKEGIAAGAYLEGAGWKHSGLISLANKYGLEAASYELSRLDKDAAFAKFEEFLKEGPVMASIHYKFDPKSTIPHLVVITGINGDTVYYNDPAGKSAGEKISLQDFMKAWKKRFIIVRA